jgi:ParB/RepB/Spo0J family partition protein
MGANAAKTLGARGRQDALAFFPEDLTLVVGNNVDPEVQALADAGHLQLRADGPVDTELSESIRIDGQLQPIRIMKDGDRKLVVLGRQRVKAVAHLNAQMPKGGDGDPTAHRIIAMVYRADEARAFAATIAENEHRTADTPTVRAQKMQRALDRGLSAEEVCRIFRIGKQQLSNMVKLLDLASEVRRAVDKGEITQSLAYTELAHLDRGEQVDALKELRANGQTRGSAAKDAVRNTRNTKNGGPQKPARQRPKPKEVGEWIEKLKDYDDAKLQGVRMGLMKALGMSPKGWGEVKAVLDLEE